VDFDILVKQRDGWVSQSHVSNLKSEISHLSFDGTVKRGSATCPCCGYTTPVASVRVQLKKRRGGAHDARLYAVVTMRVGEQGRLYRQPTNADRDAVRRTADELKRQQSKSRRNPVGRGLSLVPDELILPNELRRISVPLYGMACWGDLFAPRQALALATLARLVRESRDQLRREHEAVLADAVGTCLGLVVGRQSDFQSSLVTWTAGGEFAGHTFVRQALGMVWDFCETNLWADASGNWDGATDWVARVVAQEAAAHSSEGHVEQASATQHPLPDDSAVAIVTDPPYYDAVPYAYLSDFFFVWQKRILNDTHPNLSREDCVPKDAEIVVDRPHQLSKSNKGIAFYECELQKAFAECRRVLRPDGVCTIVFASKTTSSWEAILKAVVDAGWTITGSWPIDTERGSRMAAQGQARLASSVHLVCRPREDASGAVTDSVGEWRDVLSELPQRIHEWMPRLAAEGVVGADAIFACLGLALEIFSRYRRVEKAHGETATLREYLEFVWAAVSTEALSLIFKDADAAGLEPDARLTVMWLWTLGGGAAVDGKQQIVEVEGEESESPPTTSRLPSTGFMLEYDAARKIAQGLGIHLEQSDSIVEVKGDKARLLPVSERTRHLFGKDEDGKGQKEKANQAALVVRRTRRSGS
jgi:adenine-specific DNA methylase